MIRLSSLSATKFDQHCSEVLLKLIGGEAAKISTTEAQEKFINLPHRSRLAKRTGQIAKSYPNEI